MARKEIVELIDDLDGGPADQTIEFTWDGIDYSIDLSNKNAEKFDAQMSPWVGAAVKVKIGRMTRRHGTIWQPTVNGNGNGKNGSSVKSGEPTDEPSAADIRAWAKRKGQTVNERGRVSAELRAAYRKAHPRRVSVGK